MATIREIQQEVKWAYGFTPKMSWIAQVLVERGVERRPDFKLSTSRVRLTVCPADKKQFIEAAIDKLG